MATVEVLTSEMVVPAEETPAGAVWLSNLDLAARRGYTPTVYFFRSNGEPGFFAADAVKDSLARSLVVFYPLAGRLGTDAATGRVQIDCTGEGAVFVTARSARYALDDLMSEFAPCREMRDLFVPIVTGIAGRHGDPRSRERRPKSRDGNEPGRLLERRRNSTPRPARAARGT